MSRTDVRNMLLLLLAVVAVALTLTGVSMLRDRHDCQQSGGRWSLEGTTSWCRY